MDRHPHLPVILIVDDEPDMQNLLHLFLRPFAPQYDIITAADPQNALHHLGHRTVPLLITDYLMLGMDGLQLTAAVKAVSPTTHVILVSGDNSAEMQQRAHEQHVDTFLPKVDFFPHFEEVVRSALRLAAPLAEPAEKTAKPARKAHS